MDAHSRRAAAIEAIERIRRGERPDALESDTLDFKEETGTVGRDGARTSIPPEHEPAARALAAEAACFANTEGGVLVVGVDDKRSGPAAFIGAHLDAVWLRERIHALTLPHLSVDHVEELVVEGKRVYLVNVADALEEIRCDGKLRARVGRHCEELTGDRARHLLERRRRYDWSADPSGGRLSRAEPAALALAHRLYRQEHGRTSSSDAALVSQLGLTMGDGDDPQLNNAGAALLCALEPDRVQVNLRATVSPGAAAHERLASHAPLLAALDEAFAKLDQLFMPRHVVVGLLRRERRAIPRRAYREALVNAAMHRDFRQINSQVEVTVVGSPATTLSVRSPGAFPPGVSASRLLSVPSRPRNPTLAHALHTLGLAEREGVGIDTMYVEMLRDGHAEPEIVETGGDVLCNLFGGTPDEGMRSFFDELADRDASLTEDAAAHIAVTRLLRTTPLRPEVLADAAQCTRGEASRTLERLEQAGAIERLVNRSLSFRLTGSARERLRGRLAYSSRSPLDEHWETVRAYMDTNAEIGREAVVALLGLKPTQASTVLSALYRERGVIEPVGNAHGRGVRYRLTDRH